MNDFLSFEDNELSEIIALVNDAELFFHPEYSVDGRINYKDLFKLKSKQNSVIFDRNIVSYLIEYTTNGILRDEKNMNLIALIMLYCNANFFQISIGFALQEYFSSTNKEEKIQEELDKFLTISEDYPSMIWKRVLYSNDKHIPKVDKIKNYKRKIEDFTDKSGHQLMNECQMLVLARIYKKNISKKEKMIEFIKWNFENTLISKYTFTYAILLYGGHKEIKPPKNINSKDFEKVLKGCINQSWDLTYLSAWSTLYCGENKTDSTYFFVTNDYVLKLIFYATHSVDVLENLFNRKDSIEIKELIKELQENRVNPNVEIDTLKKLLEKEKKELREAFASKI